MFEMLDATGIPDRLSNTIYKWRGIADWPEAEAFVSDCVWTPDAELGCGVGKYQVLFSYPAKDGVQAGKLGLNGVEGHPPYRVGDTLTLRYHPKRQSRFYYANEITQLQRIGLIAFFALAGSVGAFLMIGLFPK